MICRVSPPKPDHTSSFRPTQGIHEKVYNSLSRTSVRTFVFFSQYDTRWYLPYQARQFSATVVIEITETFHHRFLELTLGKKDPTVIDILSQARRARTQIDLLCTKRQVQ